MAETSPSVVDHSVLMASALPSGFGSEGYDAASSGTVEAKKLAADRTTWNDAKGLGEKMPSIESLKYIKGEPPKAGSPLVIIFWGKYAKGDYRTCVHFSYLKRALPALEFLGISCDNSEDDAQSMLKKLGQPMPTQSIDELIFDFPLAYDRDKVVRDAFIPCTVKPPAPGYALLFNPQGILVWREIFTSSWMLKQGQFAEQCKLLLDRAPLIDNGPRPPEDDEDEEEAVTADVGDIPGIGDDDY
mmetsp:Transcript_20785/g.26894  ORF Transcript_20785/g.26894 Transcript_20785/m.26894 type:complete len:244 (-) Transcript_20785:1332-2063(-)|eukprot:CAMPEP_0197294708 /NCGR_PEP_ID=MMETSP0890-20130614/33349_1 /TAXON_ID=44058 ORGANISM="Aureoumbra lagunensis, Strain CCMP1510" /NCGR_SAMPLE_ID=MMETSP0890 /ASSEMBLY_ACC=CAM_ASM_000533 /LENGTH=243 /DNA_ID=CAMNT_0042770283 /DNA_START=61 /DNA_END=792 /DNA_ORIENTATION=+